MHAWHYSGPLIEAWTATSTKVVKDTMRIWNGTPSLSSTGDLSQNLFRNLMSPSHHGRLEAFICWRIKIIYFLRERNNFVLAVVGCTPPVFILTADDAKFGWLLQIDMIGHSVIALFASWVVRIGFYFIIGWICLLISNIANKLDKVL